MIVTVTQILYKIVCMQWEERQRMGMRSRRVTAYLLVLPKQCGSRSRSDSVEEMRTIRLWFIEDDEKGREGERKGGAICK